MREWSTKELSVSAANEKLCPPQRWRVRHPQQSCCQQGDWLLPVALLDGTGSVFMGMTSWRVACPDVQSAGRLSWKGLLLPLCFSLLRRMDLLFLSGCPLSPSRNILEWTFCRYLWKMEKDKSGLTPSGCRHSTWYSATQGTLERVWKYFQSLAWVPFPRTRESGRQDWCFLALDWEGLWRGVLEAETATENWDEERGGCFSIPSKSLLSKISLKSVSNCFGQF